MKKMNICHECKKEVESPIWVYEGEKEPVELCLECVEKDMSPEEIKEFEEHFEEQFKK
jgi:hypothetical protein